MSFGQRENAMGLEWSLPGGVWMPVVLVVGLALIRIFSRQDVLSLSMQTLAILLMGIMLLGPMQTTYVHYTTPTQTYHVLLDHSASMAQSNGTSQTRWQQVLDEVVQDPNRLDTWHELQWQWTVFAGDWASCPESDLQQIKPDGQQTNLLGALASVSDSLPADESIIVVSDGNQSTPGDLGQVINQLKKQGHTVHTLGLGKPATQPQLMADAWAEPSIGTPGQVVQLHLQIRGLATLPAGVLLPVTVLEDDNVIAEFQLPASSLDANRLTQPIKLGALGMHRYTWQINHPAFTAMPPIAFVHCVRQPVKVMLLEARPHWLTRNASRAMQMAPNVQLTARYAMGDSREIRIDEATQDQTAAHTDLQWLKQDVTILGSQTHAMLNASMQSQLLDWVRQGGGLLWLRGSEVDASHWPAALLPDDPLSDDAVQTLLSDLPLSLVPGTTAKNILKIRHLGQGLILMLDDAKFELAAVPTPAMDLLVIRLVHWLAEPLSPGQGIKADMQLDRYAARSGESVQVTVTLHDLRQPHLEVTNPTGVVAPLSLKRDPNHPLQLTGSLQVDQPGMYQLVLVSHQLHQAITVRPASDEQMYLATNHALLKTIANQTSGQFETSPAKLIQQLRDQQYHQLAQSSEPISSMRFNHPLLALPVILLWLGSWYLQRRRGGV
jgi:hypothetical protein